jgi:DNA-binding SARP family transcriptional activator
MLRLRILGPPVVERDGKVLGGAARQRRVIALLAAIASGRERGISRDRALLLFWSEKDPEKARQALTQSLYHIRDALEQDDVLIASADLRLNPAAIVADVDEFEGALDAGDLERGCALYEGPFLDGFHVNAAPEFERWVGAERKRLETRYARALEDLANAARRAGDLTGAAEWRHRLAQLDPLNSKFALELMRALAAVGDRAGAIQHARHHEEVLRRELHAAANPAIVQLAQELREKSLWVPAPAPSPIADEPIPMRIEPARSSSSPRRWRRWPLVVAGLLLAAGVAAGWSWWRARSANPAAGNMIVVVPFRVSGADPSLGYLREGLVDLLAARLGDDAAARVADPGAVMMAWRRAGLVEQPEMPRRESLALARQLGGGRLLLGSVVGTQGNFVINASLLSVPDGEQRAQASVAGPGDSLTSLVDRLVARLLAKEAGEWERLSSRTSTSVAALRAYLDGQAAFRLGRYRDAVRLFRLALERDASFAMAGLALAKAAERADAPDERARGLAAAWGSRAELTERDSAFLDALAGPRYPAETPPREHLAAWERAATIAPDRADVWHELGERLVTDGALLGLADWETRAQAAFRRAVDLDAAFASPLHYLAQLAALRGDTAEVRRRSAEYLAVDSTADLAGFVRWRAAIALGDSTRVRALRRTMAELPTAALRAILLTSQYHTLALADGDRALQVLETRVARGVERAELARAEYALGRNRGDTQRVRRAVAEMLQGTAGAPGLRILVIDALYGGADSATGAAAVDHLMRAPGSAPDCATLLWNAARDRAATAVLDDAVCAALVQATVAVRLRQPDAAGLVQRADSVSRAGLSAEMTPYAGLVLAQLYRALGDNSRALAAVQRRPFMRPWPQFFASYLRLEADLARASGNTEAAERALRRYAALRDVAPDAGEVRKELTRLSGNLR